MNALDWGLGLALLLWAPIGALVLRTLNALWRRHARYHVSLSESLGIYDDNTALILAVLFWPLLIVWTFAALAFVAIKRIAG